MAGRRKVQRVEAERADGRRREHLRGLVTECPAEIAALWATPCEGDELVRVARGVFRRLRPENVTVVMCAMPDWFARDFERLARTFADPDEDDGTTPLAIAAMRKWNEERHAVRPHFLSADERALPVRNSVARQALAELEVRGAKLSRRQFEEAWTRVSDATTEESQYERSRLLGLVLDYGELVGCMRE